MGERYVKITQARPVYRFGSINCQEAEGRVHYRATRPPAPHLDPKAAQQSAFGHLIAGGRHTAHFGGGAEALWGAGCTVAVCVEPRVLAAPLAEAILPATGSQRVAVLEAAPFPFQAGSGNHPSQDERCWTWAPQDIALTLRGHLNIMRPARVGPG